METEIEFMPKQQTFKQDTYIELEYRKVNSSVDKQCNRPQKLQWSNAIYQSQKL